MAAKTGSDETLDTTVTAEVTQTFPNGCHVAEVEIDSETGSVDIVAYTAIDDSGHLLEPMLVEGQIHGGVVQGIGQALFEKAIYDTDSGQLITGSFTDYSMPRANDVPCIVSNSSPLPPQQTRLASKARVNPVRQSAGRCHERDHGCASR